MQDREYFLEQGKLLFAGRRILFLLPVGGPAGGANVVIDEATIMRTMGVDVTLFNSASHRVGFERYYPHLDLPVIYDDWADLGDVAEDFDAVVATWHRSVEWLDQIKTQNGFPVLGYYVQGFEPYIYEQGTPEYDRALYSYSSISAMVRFTKTEWTRQEVLKYAHVDCALIGVSINIDLFRPRPTPTPTFPNRPIRVAAMVRPNSPYRAPQMTMTVLRETANHFGQQVEIVIFGTAKDDPSLLALPHDFPYAIAGVLNQKQVARLLNEIDVFVDFSYHQAMGLTALEAMACGAAVIVPAHGGAVSFARHGENSLVVDTNNAENCRQALWRLVQDHELRQRLQKNALTDVQQFHVEGPAFNILRTLFDPDLP